MDLRKKKKILFVSHDASMTGAPIVLLKFLEWLKGEDLYEIFVFLKKDGELSGDFEKIVQTYLPVKKNWINRNFEKVISKLASGGQKFKLPSALQKKPFDLIYLNTIVCLDIAGYLKTLFNCPIICHVHENEFSLKFYYPKHIIPENLSKIDQFITVSNDSRDSFIEQFKIEPQKVTMIYPFASLTEIKTKMLPAHVVKKELDLSDEFIVGGSGVACWRKGTDLFLQLAFHLNKMRPGNRIKLIWVGTVDYEFAHRIEYEASRMGISGQVIFTGQKAFPQNYFQLFDVFALISREEPFGLVALEAAALCKPVLCFENAGGILEFFGNDTNVITVPYLDVVKMAQEILELMDDENKRVNMGKELAKIVENIDVNISGKKIVSVIDQQIL
jgi:glycosyltransferase involved in cell wall biosynthesis